MDDVEAHTLVDGVEVWLPVLAAFVGLAGGVVTTLLSLRTERRAVHEELEFERTKFEEEIAAQRAALNPRWSMMCRSVEKMDAAKREAHLARAEAFLGRF